GVGRERRGPAAPLAAAADRDRPQLAGPHQGIGLGGGDGEHVGDIAERYETWRHRRSCRSFTPEGRLLTVSHPRARPGSVLWTAAPASTSRRVGVLHNSASGPRGHTG